MRILTLFLGGLLAMGCGSSDENTRSSRKELTSATGVERTIAWDGYVYVPTGADTGAIETTIARQIKSAIGALRTREIALQSRDALPRLDPTRWTTDTLTVIDTSNPAAPPRQIERVGYHYADTAMVRAGTKTTTFQLPLLFGDYLTRSREIIPACSDELTIGPDLLWFHFKPTLGACQVKRYDEENAVLAAARSLGEAPLQTTLADVNRLYYEVSADLTPVAAPRTTYPEYDRLWGFGTDRNQLIVYAFFGVDGSDHVATDASLVEYLRFLRTLREAFPQYHVALTIPRDRILDYSLDGARVAATHEDTFNWIIDSTGFPAGVTDAGRREQLTRQVVDHYSERWVYWDLPVTVTRGAESRNVTVEVRAYWGYDNEKPEYREAARARYLEGMRRADVFLYQGHSHYGRGPLDPAGYSSGDFPRDHYQTMLFNSCISFNYYDTAYLALHPGGSRDLDIVVNGLTSYWPHLGESSARYVLGLTDGKNRSWKEILGDMMVNRSSRWPEPMRIVNGELDNEFDPESGKIDVTPRLPAGYAVRPVSDD